MIILLIIAICLLVWLCFLILPIKKKQINLISSNKKEDDLLLPIIDIEIAGIKTKAIIDTGSSLNIINKRFAMNNNVCLLPPVAHAQDEFHSWQDPL